MGASEDRQKLLDKLVELEAHRRTLKRTRGHLQQRAMAMHDATHDPIDAYTDALEAGKGGVLSHRRLRTLLTERSRLAAVTHQAEAERDGG